MSRLRLVGPVVLGVTLLAGCQSNPEPPPLETAPSSSSPSASPTPTPPALPDEAKGTSAAAAKAFVRHYIELVNFAMATGDVASMTEMSGPECRTCAAMVDQINDVYSKGGRLEGAGWSVISLQVVDSRPPTSAFIAAGISISPQIAYDGAGAQPSRSPRSRGNLDFQLERHGNAWRVRSLAATQ